MIPASSGLSRAAERSRACPRPCRQGPRPGEAGDERDAGRRRKIRRLVGEDVEGVGEKRIAGEDGGRIVVGLVDGRLAPAKVVVVHGRQVVMDERIAVDAFERGGHAKDGRPGHAEQSGALDHQERPQALAAVEDAVPHRRQEAFRPRDLAVAGAIVQQVRQDALDRNAVLLQTGLEHRVAHRQADGGIPVPRQARPSGAGFVAVRPRARYDQGHVQRERRDWPDRSSNRSLAARRQAPWRIQAPPAQLVRPHRPGPGRACPAAGRADAPLCASGRPSGLDADGEGPRDLPGLRPAVGRPRCHLAQSRETR